jgi:hypothetical protein
MTDFHGYPIRVVGIAWFRKDDYPALLKIFEDADKFAATWDEWIKRAEKAEQRLKNEGHMTERVYIDPDTFPDWCRKEGLSIGSHARHKFAASVVAEKYRTRG